jgi:hypothetical protein
MLPGIGENCEKWPDQMLNLNLLLYKETTQVKVALVEVNQERS